MFCALADLVTESDVEQKLLWPMLNEPSPAGLGYSTAEVLTKHSLRRLEIGKGASTRLYYPDYVIIVQGVPLLIVEAKRPGEDLGAAAEEARMYAARVNELFPRNVNPCAWVLASDGATTILGGWDSQDVVQAVVFDELSIASSAYARLVGLVGRQQLAERASAFRREQAAHPLLRAVSEMGGVSTRNEQIGHNTFGSTLALDFRSVFTPVSPQERAYVVRNAYVGSKRRERYVEPIDRLIRDAAPPVVAHVPQLDDTEQPREVIKTLALGASLEHQLMLLVGSVGSGKSTFVDYLVNVALPEEVLRRTVWLRVNLNLAPRETTQDWVLQQIAQELMASAPEMDFDDLDTLQTMYGPELAKLRKGPLKLLEPESIEYRTRIADELLSLQKDRVRTVNALSRYLCGERRKLLVLVLDNCDKRTRDEQLAMFQLAQWVQSELRCLTVLPLRDVTYDLHQHEPPLDALQKSLVFRIEPPQFTRVLSGRVALSLKELSRRGGEMLEYALSNGMRVSYPASDQGMYLASILKSLYEHDRFLRRLLSGLAGRNIRRALEIFLDFCQSGYISEGEIFKIRQFQGNYALPLPVVASVLLRLNRRFYDGDASYVKNVFQADPTDASPDHFVRLAVLTFLSNRRDKKGPSGVRGYHRVDAILLALAALGHSAERARQEVRYFVAAGCIVAEHQRTDVADADLVALSAAGSVQLEMLDSVHYLAACAEDTWFSDHEAVGRIAGRIGATRLAHLAEATVLQNARELVDLISAEESRWRNEASAIMTDEAREQLHPWQAAIEAVERGERDQRARARSGRLYVGNLPFAVTTDEIVAVFVTAGLPVVDLHIPKAPNGGGKGYAFVSVGTPQEVERAIRALSGIRIQGRSINVNVADERRGGRRNG